MYFEILVSVCLTLCLQSSILVECFNRRVVCDKIKFDNCASNLIILGNPELKYAETREDMDEHCRKLPKNVKCMKDYTRKCLDTFPRQASGLLVYSIAKYYKSWCAAKEKYHFYSNAQHYYNHSSRNRKQNYYSIKNYMMANCINSVKRELDNCSTNSVQTLMKISRLNQSRYKIPLICCHYWIFNDCMVKAIRDESTMKRICTETHVSEFVSLTKSVMETTIRYLCSGYTNGSDKCKDLISTTNLYNNNTTTPEKTMYKTILPPLIEIFQSF